MFQKLKDIVNFMHDKGLSIPLLKDHEYPSVSLTLLFISSLFVILGLVSIPVKALQVDFWHALSWHVTSAVLYYNRGAKVSKDGIELSGGSNEVHKE